MQIGGAKVGYNAHFTLATGLKKHQDCLSPLYSNGLEMLPISSNMNSIWGNISVLKFC
jgi:hypothetical protein